MITTRNTDVANSSQTVVTLYILVYIGRLLLCSVKMKAVNFLKTPEVSPDFPNRLCCWWWLKKKCSTLLMKLKIYSNGCLCCCCCCCCCLLHCVPISPSLTFGLHCRKSQRTVEQSTVEPWIASIIRSRNVLVIQNTRISKCIFP